MLSPGTVLGPYETVAFIGAGGMGEVYRARDTRLGRDVALKILPDAVVADPERLARFRREAQLLASLNHPHIAAVYGLEEGQGHLAIALELVEGEGLEVRLARGRVSIEEAIGIARQIAEGLEAAHERGIVHRDLKPANVKLTPERSVKILDFGLAKSLAAEVLSSSSGSEASNLATHATIAGMIVGTAAYMAPEQARGQAVDKRADIWAFGVLLYEMIGGRRPFGGETLTDTLAAVLTQEPDYTALPLTTPPNVRALLSRCLQRDVKLRLRDIGEARIALSNTAGTAVLSASAPTDLPDMSRPVRVTRILSALLLAAAATITALLMWPSPPAPEPVRIRQLTFTGTDFEPSASPDGRILAFTSTRDGTSRIWLKQLAGGGEQPLTGGPDLRPSFSPDGSAVIFLRQERQTFGLYRMPLVGGQERKLLDDVIFADISPDGRRIAFVRGNTSDPEKTRIGIASEDGERILQRFETWEILGIAWSRDGRTLVVTRNPPPGGASGFALLLIDADTGAMKESGIGTVAGGSMSRPIWSVMDPLVLVAAADVSMGDISGLPARVLIADPANGRTETLFWTLGLFPFRGTRQSSTRLSTLGPGRVVFDTWRQEESLREQSIDGSGERVLTTGTAVDRQPAYSPDGKTVVFSSNRAGNLDLWTVDVATGALRQITDDPAQDWDPGFTFDGRIVFSSNRGGHLEIWIVDADGANARQVSRDGVDAQNPTMTRDGRWVVHTSGAPERRGIWRVRPDGSDAAPVVSGSFSTAEVSPDGRHVLYLGSNAAQLRNEIRVAEIDSGRVIDFRIPVPFAPFAPDFYYGRARWMPDGRAIAFLGTDERGRPGVFVQDFAAGQDTASTRRALAGFQADALTESFGISPDGTRIMTAVLRETRSLMLAEGLRAVK